jgi:hypothetical protein
VGARRIHALLLDLRLALERTYFQQIHALGFDLLVNNNGFSTLPCPAPHGIYMCMFPHELKGELRPDENRSFLRKLYVNIGNRVVGMSSATLDSYDVITANSQFTSEWIRRLWRHDSSVVYSACEDMGPAAAKRPMIMHVGRFVEEWRNDYKHQRTLPAPHPGRMGVAFCGIAALRPRWHRDNRQTGAGSSRPARRDPPQCEFRVPSRPLSPLLHLLARHRLRLLA